ncbi:hypothetical protein GGTG_08243 [Gaeumannomyces tritici R3-111a-1]|uniref:Uncharacterized protein n=1 Tax=Gaeumannomyces tritici (strain R3-111a-1) TaxID=644352 RepID=J3P407_GAET3|nr:hypothetical protein GGTG_08243 [Gaeumannomyces tritici R3-111a-1]EJT74402.1 hypothetical protein GGTG_08243 [Gaeumannomyces tritici R3-111a-1]
MVNIFSFSVKGVKPRLNLRNSNLSKPNFNNVLQIGNGDDNGNETGEISDKKLEELFVLRANGSKRVQSGGAKLILKKIS